MNSKKQGNIGLGRAIAEFTKRGFTVSLPLNDSQKYDLIVDRDGKLARVDVKTTRYANRYGNPEAELATHGGNQSFHTKKYFDAALVDEVFILDLHTDSVWLIPSKSLPKTSVTLGSKYEQYRLDS